MKQDALHLLRRLRLLPVAEAARYRWAALRGRAGRRDFERRHPSVALPPDDVAYDAYGMLHWDFYWGFGELAAAFIADRISPGRSGGRVLEWGCGPARIVRHLPARLGSAWAVHGTDANEKTIAWCSAHMPGVAFESNAAEPPLPFSSSHFDAVYAVSVFTHLSADLHHKWIRELGRVLKPGGLLICTLNGEASRSLLLPFEARAYDGGELVVRGDVAGGTRCFVAYHPPRFVRQQLLREFDIQEHIPAPNLLGERQDIWIARLRSSGA